MCRYRFSKQYTTLIVLITLTACAGPRYWPAKTGRVLEEGTDKPIAGAIVMATWHGSLNVAFVDTQSTCYHVETVLTDDQGYYRIEPRFDGLLRGDIHAKHMRVDVYKEGYDFSMKTLDDSSIQQNLYYLKPFLGAKKERLDYLFYMLGIASCGTREDEMKNTGLYKSIYKEAKALADAQRDKQILIKIRHTIASIWDGKDVLLNYEESDEIFTRDLKDKFE